MQLALRRGVVRRHCDFDATSELVIAVQGRSSGVGFRRGGGFARGHRNSDAT